MFKKSSPTAIVCGCGKHEIEPGSYVAVGGPVEWRREVWAPKCALVAIKAALDDAPLFAGVGAMDDAIGKTARRTGNPRRGFRGPRRPSHRTKGG